MKKLLAMLLRPPAPHLLGLALLTAVVYYGGRALRSWLGLSNSTLLILCGCIWLFAGLLFVWKRYQANQRARLIEDRLRGQAREHKESVRPDRRNQVEELERQLGEALTALKSSKMGKSALYALPWYVIIGPPGSGKTTLLRESGLSFPEVTHGRGVRGVGGTRNCDWWFTDSGILLDTAGRYTTQDEDRSEWLAFLDMLKKARSRKPINGAMIAISITDLVQGTEEQVAEHARKIRERLAELTEHLEVVFPVYLLFSKCDLLDGFVETFDGYGKKERSQVWGFTLPYHRDGTKLAEQFDREFDALHARLSAERLQTFGSTKSQAKKAKIFSFPMQFQLAKARLRSFLSLLDQPNPYHESSDIRGFYFTSGTQEGKPLDQVLQRVREAVGLTEAAEEATKVEDQEVEKKAYFIDSLFTDIVFEDKELAQSSAKAERRRELIQRVSMITAAAATLVLLVMLVVKYAGQANLIERSINAYTAAEAFDPSDPRALAEEERLADQAGGPFEQLRRAFVELDDAYGTVGSYVMGQTNALYEQRIRPLYANKLKATFLEPIQRELQTQLNATIAAKGKDREVRDIQDRLRGYRMLGNSALLDREWLGGDFLKRDNLWSWRKGKEVAACREHRDTFITRIIGPSFRDWVVMPEEKLIPEVRDLLIDEDIYGEKLREVLKEQGQEEDVPWSQILKQNPHADLLDDNVGVTTAYVNEAAIDATLESKGAVIAERGGEILIIRKRTDAIDKWTTGLAQMRPRRKSNLADAMADVAKLTGEDSIYLLAYDQVCDHLNKLLDEPFDPGETAWLVETIKAIHDLQEDVGKLCEASDHLDRIVAAARNGKGGTLNDVVRAFKKARKKIQSKTSEYAPPQVTEAIQSALMGAVDALHYALAREIVEETSKVWSQGMGKELARFSQRFPFRKDGKESVDSGRFDKVFGKDGEFDEELKWISYLESTLEQIGFAAMTEDFAADRTLVTKIHRALFADGSEAGCDIEFQIEKRGNMKAVRFVLGDNDVLALRRQNPTFSWRPADGATMAIVELQLFDNPVSSRLEFRDTWGFLRLLAAGANDTTEYRDKTYQVCLWSDFKHPETGQPLVTGDVRAEAALLFRTEAEPNPLEPGFFTHSFAEEVFDARER